MTEERRKRSADRSGRRPGAPRRGRSTSRKETERKQAERKLTSRERAAAAAGRREEERGRSRFTGRMAVLVLVLAVLAVSYASSLRAYLQQRSHIDALEQRIETTTGEIEDLEREKDRWEDPAYVAQQARIRFGYVEPGETPFVVLDEDGKPIGGGELTDPEDVGSHEQPAWFDDLWESAKVAGNPPRKAPAPPARKIEGEKKSAE